MPALAYTLEINLTKSKWAPAKVLDIPELVSRAFETHVTLRDIRPLIGTDHVQKWPINEDSDIPVFMNAKSQMREAFAEKVIKFSNPRGMMPANWRPKKVKILAKGPRLMKYFGEEQMGTRQVQVSVKFFECGHFYMKQTLPGSGPCPYQIVFEGKWEESDRGFRFQYLLRYTGQTSKQSDMDLAIQALPPNHESFLAATGEFENKNQLNGLVPATVGEDQFARVELFREPDVVEKCPARFNEDCPDPPSWSDPTPTGFKPKPKKEEEEDEPEPPKVQFEPRQFEPRFTDRPPTEEAPRLRSCYQKGTNESTSATTSTSASARTTASASGGSGSGSGEHQWRSSSGGSHGGSRGSDQGSAQSRNDAPTGAEAHGRRPDVAGASASPADAQQQVGTDEEPMWPMLLGLALFIILFVFFGWLNYQERFGSGPTSRVATTTTLPHDAEEW